MRPVVIHATKISRRVLALGRVLYPPHNVRRPRTRLECPTDRPCPWVGCKHHLYVDITRNGSLQYNFPDCEPWELKETCALDIAEDGAHTFAEVGELLNLSSVRVYRLEQAALKKARATR